MYIINAQIAIVVGTNNFNFYYNLQIWDLATGTLKLSLTGHISTVRGLVVSPRQPYLFSCGEDKQVKCWDLEYNKVCIVLSIITVP